MGWFSNLFGGNDNNAPSNNEAQPTDGTFNDRSQACADCDDIYLCSAHLAEMKSRLDGHQEEYYCGLCGRFREISHFPH